MAKIVFTDIVQATVVHKETGEELKRLRAIHENGSFGLMATIDEVKAFESKAKALEAIEVREGEYGQYATFKKWKNEGSVFG